MEKKITITLLANAGLLIQYNGYVILLDALQKSENVPFSPLPSDLWRKILSADGQFSKVDALIFTHLHPDHFSAEMTIQYLKQHTTPIVLMPKDPSASEFGLIASQTGNHFVPLSSDSPARYVLTPEISILSIPTRHIDKRYYDVPHYCYLISFGTKNVLITADIDYTHETLSILDGIPLDAVFINPLFLSALRFGKFFKGSLNAEHFCTYHIPFPSDDKNSIRKIVKNNVSHWPGSGIMDILELPLQQVII